jgi:acetyl esterase/lipase
MAFHKKRGPQEMTLHRIVVTAGFLLTVAGPVAASPEATPTPGAPSRWQPETPTKQLPLWPKGLTIAQPPVDGPETFKEGAITNVTRPTMTIYPPRAKGNGSAVVVAPGGGFMVLAIKGEGTDICDWLTSKGVTCVLLKYRVPTSGPQWDGACRCRHEPTVHMATQDAQRAIALVRHQAGSLGIDPNKVGIIGFSAGGHIVADVSNAKGPIYAPVDEADKEGVRPNFAIAAYPGHLWEGKGLALNPTLHVTANTPPTFIVQAEDDPVDNIRHSLSYYVALKQAGVPVEMHLYAQGGHAFGLKHPDWPIGAWPNLAEKWMRSLGMLR